MKLVDAKKMLTHHYRSNSSVVLVTGKWGVGKSYLINEFLSDEIAIFPGTKYIRISAFNASSILDFRNSLGTEYLSRFVQKAEIKRQIHWMSAIISATPWVNKFTPNIGAKLGEIGYLQISNTTIWVDDLERTSDDRLAKEILGEVAYFVENRNCKAIIACNIERFDHSPELKSSIEKVCTSHFEFERDYGEILKIGLKGFESCEHIVDIAKSLVCRNIRVLDRVERALNILTPDSSDIDSNVTKQIGITAILATIAKYGSDKSINSIENLYTHGTEHKKEKEHSPQEAALNALGYTHTDPLDRVVIKFVDKGVFDEEAYAATVTDNARQVLDSTIRNEYRMLIGGSYSNFANSAENILQAAESFIQKFQQNLEAYHYNGILVIFKALNIQQLIDKFMESVPQSFEINFSSRQSGYFGNSLSNLEPEILSRIIKIDVDKDKRSLEGLIPGLIDNNGWWQEDEEILANLDPADLATFLFEKAKNDGARTVQRLLEFGIYTGATQRQIQISVIAAKAIRLLEQMNPTSKIVNAQFKKLIASIEIAAKAIAIIGPEDTL